MNVEQFHARLKELYLPPPERFTLVDVPEIRYAAIDGSGNPDGLIGEAVKWLYAIAHLVKPLIKERMGKTFIEPPLECLFWADDPQDFLAGHRAKWKWRAMIVFVDWITEAQFADALAKAEGKRGPAPPTLRLQTLREGKSVQMLHVGDYGEIASICEKLYNEFLPANGLVPNGRYHEIYLNDPSRVAPEKRRIVIRQPVK